MATEIADIKKYHFDDHDLLRFCRARKFVLADIQTMFTNFVTWRKVNKIDTIITEFKFDELDTVKKIYPHGYHGIDKQGRPVYIERFGVLNVPKLFENTTEERMMRHYTLEYEVLMKLRFPACSEVAGKKILQGLTLFDMTGGSITTANSHTYGLFKIAS